MQIGYYFSLQKLKFNNEKIYQSKNNFRNSNAKDISFRRKKKKLFFYRLIIFNEYIEILGQN